MSTGGKVLPQRDFIAFAAYVTLFPQLIAGPIVRYSDVAEMLVGRKTNLDQIAEGVRRFIVGFGKKVLLANQVYVFETKSLSCRFRKSAPLRHGWARWLLPSRYI